MTPERIEPIKLAAFTRGELIKLIRKQESALEEAQQQSKEWQEEAKQWRDEFVSKNDELGEAQQTIDRLQAAFEDEGSYKPKYRMYAEENLLLIEEGKS
ncbi:hypothetical protein [Paenibacillus sp. FSL H3-0286]|uniref:hypothetical protein n=1 Tax=Paenibacillus sp. FSL H3-0286 TaxID=2921427 RepID=UPI00324E88DC